VIDYIELYVQWGFLVLFGSAFPCTTFLAFATNFIETRTDGAKLFNDYRRVLPNQVFWCSGFLVFWCSGVLVSYARSLAFMGSQAWSRIVDQRIENCVTN